MAWIRRPAALILVVALAAVFAARVTGLPACPPAEGSWAAVTRDGAPRGRDGHSLIWSGSEAIVWGGVAFPSPAPASPGAARVLLPLNDGGRYDPAADTWTAITADGAPEPRHGHAGVWTGTELLIWGGATFPPTDLLQSPTTRLLANGARYVPGLRRWESLRGVGVSGRSREAGVWTGDALLVWGGVGEPSPMRQSMVVHGVLPDEVLWDGYVVRRSCAGLSKLPDAPQDVAPRVHLPVGGVRGVWTGEELVVWGAAPDDPALKGPGTGLRFRFR